MKALGIDPGTSTFDFCCLDDRTGRAIYEAAIPTSVVAKSPESLLRVVKDVEADVILGPSAMGLPVTHLSEMTDLKLAQATLGKNTEVDIAIRRFIKMLQRLNLNVFFIPSVIQLPTVPIHRKRNKVDMGTADKTCISALALWDYVRRHGGSYQAANLMVLELGFGFNAIMAIEHGKLIDGIGGTIFPGPGYLTIGGMDLELIHILGSFTEAELGYGGIAYAAAGDLVPPEEYAEMLRDEARATAWRSLEEGVVKAVAMERTVFEEEPDEILLSGRLTRVPRLYASLVNRLSRYELPVRKLEGYASKSKEAAQGAALIASGLAGGTYAELVDVLELRGARGTVLDYICWPGFDAEERIAQKLRAMKL